MATQAPSPTKTSHTAAPATPVSPPIPSKDSASASPPLTAIAEPTATPSTTPPSSASSTPRTSPSALPTISPSVSKAVPIASPPITPFASPPAASLTTAQLPSPATATSVSELQPSSPLSSSDSNLPTPLITLKHARDYWHVAIPNVDALAPAVMGQIYGHLKYLYRFKSLENESAGIFALLSQGISNQRDDISWSDTGFVTISCMGDLDISQCSRGADPTGKEHGIFDATEMQQEFKRWYQEKNGHTSGERAGAYKPDFNVRLRVMGEGEEESDAYVFALLGERKLFSITKKGSLRQSTASRTTLTPSERQSGPPTDDDVEPDIQRLPMDQRSISVKKCKGALARSLLYLISGNQACGTYLGLVQVHTRFSRLFHLDTVQDEHGTNDGQFILFEVSDTTLASFISDNDNVNTLSQPVHTILASNFIRALKGTSFLAHDFSRVSTDTSSTLPFDLDRGAARVYFDAHLTAVDLLLDQPVSKLPLPRLELSDTAKQYKRDLVECGALRFPLDQSRERFDVAYQARDDIRYRPPPVDSASTLRTKRSKTDQSIDDQNNSGETTLPRQSRRQQGLPPCDETESSTNMGEGRGGTSHHDVNDATSGETNGYGGDRSVLRPNTGTRNATVPIHNAIDVYSHKFRGYWHEALDEEQDVHDDPLRDFGHSVPLSPPAVEYLEHSATQVAEVPVDISPESSFSEDAQHPLSYWQQPALETGSADVAWQRGSSKALWTRNYALGQSAPAVMAQKYHENVYDENSTKADIGNPQNPDVQLSVDMDSDAESQTDDGPDGERITTLGGIKVSEGKQLTAENLLSINDAYDLGRIREEEEREKKVPAPPLDKMCEMLDDAKVVLILVTHDEMERLWSTKGRCAKTT